MKSTCWIRKNDDAAGLRTCDYDAALAGRHWQVVWFIVITGIASEPGLGRRALRPDPLARLPGRRSCWPWRWSRARLGTLTWSRQARPGARETWMPHCVLPCRSDNRVISVGQASVTRTVTVTGGVRVRVSKRNSLSKLESPCSTRAAKQRRCGELRPWLHWKGLTNPLFLTRAAKQRPRRLRGIATLERLQCCFTAHEGWLYRAAPPDAAQRTRQTTINLNCRHWFRPGRGGRRPPPGTLRPITAGWKRSLSESAGFSNLTRCLYPRLGL